MFHILCVPGKSRALLYNKTGAIYTPGRKDKVNNTKNNTNAIIIIPNTIYLVNLNFFLFYIFSLYNKKYGIICILMWNMIAHLKVVDMSIDKNDINK